MIFERPWGYYRVLHEDEGVKVKELTINPGCSISMQRHFKRSEHWHIVDGFATVEYQKNPKWKNVIAIVLKKYDSIDIAERTWHRVHNNDTQPLKIVEIQYGTECVESDIERDNDRFSRHQSSTPTDPYEVLSDDSAGC